jgi:hypothetical protein
MLNKFGAALTFTLLVLVMPITVTLTLAGGIWEVCADVYRTHRAAFRAALRQWHGKEVS